MNRDSYIATLKRESRVWDIIVIGGGATGLGVGVDAASRGFRTLLLEQHDFSKGTSSRSTKLIHGGVRYLRQGNFALVFESLHERGLLVRNAPHLVRNLLFLVPSYTWWDGPFHGAGMKVYDLLAGKLGLGPSRRISRDEILKRMPTIEPAGLQGGVLYHDGQFDDARLAVNLAQTMADLDGAPVNYMKVVGLLKREGRIEGVSALDLETGESHQIRGRAVVNAAGVFSDGVRALDDPGAKPVITPSQGVHLVLPERFLPGGTAVMVPHTEDGRVLFAVPWHGVVLLGTTDTPVAWIGLEPRPFDAEVEFLLKHAARLLTEHPSRRDVLSVFAGLRPLVAHPGGHGSTAAISRDHFVHVSGSGMVTITGGKWTTYRRMAEDAVASAIEAAGLERRPCPTRELPIHGWMKNLEGKDPLEFYGADLPRIRSLALERPCLGEKLHAELPCIGAEVVWAVRAEMARTVEDVLARRTRALFVNARASMEAAPAVASIMAEELGRDRDWMGMQVRDYLELAEGYLLA